MHCQEERVNTVSSDTSCSRVFYKLSFRVLRLFYMDPQLIVREKSVINTLLNTLLLNIFFFSLVQAHCAFEGSNVQLHGSNVQLEGSDVRNCLPAVCTGNWGCGAFGGDKQLKGKHTCSCLRKLLGNEAQGVSSLQ